MQFDEFGNIIVSPWAKSTGGGGGSCKFYECTAVIEQTEGGVLVSGITGLYGYSDDEVNGLYTYGELTDCIASTGYTHEKGKMWIYKHPNYVFWLITYSKQAPDPGTSIAYCRGDASANPWELTWELNSGSGTVVVEQAPPADASWSGYEWSLEGTAYEKSSTITEGLSWTSVKPEIGKTYTEDALVEVASLYQSEDNGGTEEPDVPAPDEPEEPEEPEASFGTYLQISGSTAVNEGLAGVYKLNESASTDIHKEWININDDTKKVSGGFVDIDPATYWTVFGGSDNYDTVERESSISYPWNADNSSFVWYYHAEPVSDFHVTPYVSDEEDPSTGGNGSDEPTVETTINSFTITGASEYSEVNGTYTKTSDTSSKTGTDAQYSMKSGDNEYLCYYVNTCKWWVIYENGYKPMYYAITTADNPWEVTTWLGGFTEEKDSSIKVVAEAGTSGGTTDTNTGIVLVVSGSYQSDDNGNYSPGAADGEYTLKDPSATGAARVWVNSNGIFELRAETSGGTECSLWGLYNTSGMYDHYTYWIDNGHNEPINSDGSSVVWKLQGPDSNMKVVKK